MSIEIVLLPLAIAAVSAWRAGKAEEDSANPRIVTVETRMRDEGLLELALNDTGARVTTANKEITADWLGIRSVFRRAEDGVWRVALTGDVDEKRATEIALSVDRAYGLRVQQAVVARLRERAEVAGMRIESEHVEDDASILVTLNLGASR